MTSASSPQLRKAAFVKGRTLAFRNATAADAEFILDLRTDAEKSRHLNPISGRLCDQQAWIDGYSRSEGQAYFLIESAGEAIGTVRLYDAQGDSFCWGSWILKNTAHPQAAIESALMVYAYGIDHLHFTGAHFDVRKNNRRVWQFHERFGAVRTTESELDYFFRINGRAIATARLRYRKFLPDGVSVEYL